MESIINCAKKWATESARAMTNFHTFSIGKLPDVVVASCFTVETSLDARAEVFDLRKDEVDFCGHAGDIETPDI